MFQHNYILLFFSLCFSMGFTQGNRMDFKAFGMIPQDVQPELYQKLKNAKNINERLSYLDEIAQIFLDSGNADSLLFYSDKLKRGLVLGRPDDSDLKYLKLKSIYYKGIATQKIGFLDEAISIFIEGIEDSKDNIDFKNLFQLELAQTYLLKRQLKKAKPILEDISVSETNPQFYLNVKLAQSTYHILNGDYDTAQSIINSALSDPFIDDYLKLKLKIQLGLAKIELAKGNYNGAVAISSSTKSVALNNRFYDIYIDGSLGEGMAYTMLKEYDVSEMALSSAYANTLQWNRLELQQKVIGALVRLYEAKGNFENAYSLMTQYQNVSRQIDDKQNQRLVRDLEFKYETLQKENQIDKLEEEQLIKQAEIERQKTIKYAFLIGFIIILIPVILLLIVYYQKLQTQSLLSKQQDAISQQELKSLLQSQELTLAKNTISVQQKERDRIARELHDSIGGNLAGIKLKMNSLGDNHPDFKKILNQLDTTYEQVREISHSLIPKTFEDSNFTELVKDYIHNFSEDTSVNLSFDAYPKDHINALDTNLQVTLFNIIKELVTNAFKHAKASEISLQLTSLIEEKSIELIYEDDGVGFNLEDTSKGIGLSNIESRVKEINGIFSVNSALNRGTVITLSIPQT